MSRRHSARFIESRQNFHHKDDVFGCIYTLTRTDFTLEEQRVQAVR
nr:hypothetical protein [Succinispira mobilis]